MLISHANIIMYHKTGFRVSIPISDAGIENLIYTLLSTLYEFEGLPTLRAHVAQRIGKIEGRSQEAKFFIVEDERPESEKQPKLGFTVRELRDDFAHALHEPTLP